MTPPRSLVGTLAGIRQLRSFPRRAAVFGLMIGALVALTFFPERHRAVASITPVDRESLGLSGTLGQLGALNSVFGNQAAVEMAMRVAKSVDVRDIVIREVRLDRRLGEPDRIELHRWLEERVTIRSLRGGIITMEMQHRDSQLARDVIRAYNVAVQLQLAEISRKQTAYKREVLVKLVSDASEQLARAQSAFDTFRLRNRYADPRSSIEAIGERVPRLEATIKAKEVQLAATRGMFTDQNIVVRQILGELAALRQQLAVAKATGTESGESVGRLVQNTSQLFKLERDLGIAKALYDSYMRYLQGTAVEDLTSTANVRVLEEAHVDTTRQIYLPAAAAALAFMLLWMAIEFYRLRPPVGSQLEPKQT